MGKALNILLICHLEGLRDYFCKFGEVNECMVMRDPSTKRARGFGFITFVDPTAVEKVLGIESHELDGKRIDPKIAFPKKQQPKMVVKTKKVFIGGLSSNSTVRNSMKLNLFSLNFQLEDLKAYFSQYGRIDDAMLMFDKTTQRHRGNSYLENRMFQYLGGLFFWLYLEKEAIN